MARFYIEHPRLQALTEEVQKKVKDELELYGVPVSKVSVNGIFISGRDGYIQYSEMEAIVNLLREICG